MDLSHLLVDGSIASYGAVTIYRQYRKIQCLKELLRREKEESFSRCNVLVKNLTDSFLKGPTLTLRDLAADTVGSFRLKSSEKP